MDIVGLALEGEDTAMGYAGPSAQEARSSGASAGGPSSKAALSSGAGSKRKGRMTAADMFADSDSADEK